MNKTKRNEQYLHILFSILKRRDKISFADGKTHFNDTEIRLLSEILDAKYNGKRLISTQLANLLGCTRSAVSQMVNRLEEKRVVKRVPDDIDRKIAYVEITEETMVLYEEDIKKSLEFVGRIVDRFGEDKFEQMHELFEEFMGLVEDEKKKSK